MDRIRGSFDFHDIPVTVSYLRRKKGPTSPWLVLLHGLQTSNEMFLPLTEQSFLKNYSMLIPDFLGFGFSSRPDQFTYDLKDQAEIVRALLKHERVEQFDLIGHSLGGMVGCFLIESEKDRVARFANVEGNLRADDGGASNEIAKMDFGKFRGEHLPRLIASLAKPKTFSEKIRYAGLGRAAEIALFRTACSIAAYSRSGEVFDIFKKSSIKRCLIRGELSRFGTLPPNIACREFMIEGGDHFMLMDEPMKFYTVLSEFLT